ncbi:MAG: CvpA family protein [Candidatus Uhrbacteria bacterium]|nr:CvpA family protein [Candidatus Uhrbacteria bacterium]
MTPLIIDIIIAIVAFGLIATGWRHGLVRTLGSLVGLVLSLIVAFYGAAWIEQTFGFSFISHPISGIILFLTLALIVSQIAGWAVNILDLGRRVLSIVPFVGLVNSLGGALVGVVQAAFAVFAFAYVTIQVLPDSTFRTASLASQFVSKAVDVLYSGGLL